MSKQINLRNGDPISWHLEFEPVPHLKRLPNDLAATVAPRYEKAPFKQDREDLEELAFHMRIYKRNERKTDLLKGSGWLAKIWRDYIACHEWPPDDGALPSQASTVSR